MILKKIGYMLKSIYDTDDNGIVDEAEILNDGTNTVSALQARSHIDNVNKHIDWTNATEDLLTSGALTAAKLLHDVNTFIDKDGSNNMTFTDAVTGTKTLAELAAGGGGASPLTTKGDIYSYDTADARLPIGANGLVLTADSAEALGMKWASASGISFGLDNQIPYTNASVNDYDYSSDLTFDGSIFTMKKQCLLGGATSVSQGLAFDFSNAYAQYKLNDNAATTSIVDNISGNNLTASANTNILTTSGWVNEALDFSSNNHAKKDNFSAVGSGNFTILLAFKHPGASSSYRIMFCESNTAKNEELYITLTNTDKLRFSVGANTISQDSVNTYDDNAWHTAVMIRRAANDWTFIIDGDEEIFTSSTTSNHTYAHFCIGAFYRQQATSSYFGGSMDNVIVLREPITNNEAKEWHTAVTENLTKVGADINIHAISTTATVLPTYLTSSDLNDLYIGGDLELEGKAYLGDLLLESLVIDGGVLFSNGTTLAQESTFKYDSANKRLGVGTATPAFTIEAYKAILPEIGITHTNTATYGKFSFNEGTTWVNAILSPASAYGTVNRRQNLEFWSRYGSLGFFTNSIERFRIAQDGTISLNLDNQKLKFGLGEDASMTYDGTNFIINPKEVGSGYLSVLGNLIVDGKIGIGETTPTAYLHLKAGTASAGTAPIKFEAGTLLTTPESGTIEYDGNKFYITNNGKQKAIDRTSDVATSTVTVENTTVETTLWTGDMPANCLDAGNMFKFHADGVVENGGSTAADEVTIRIKVGGVTKVTLNPNTKTLASNTPWHIEANACQRTIGASGSRAMHIHLVIGDPTSTGDEIRTVAVANIDTTASMDVTVTAQWASADAANIISLYQGFMEYKN